LLGEVGRVKRGIFALLGCFPSECLGTKVTECEGRCEAKANLFELDSSIEVLFNHTIYKFKTFNIWSSIVLTP
jgi:hypothetical protein